MIASVGIKLEITKLSYGHTYNSPDVWKRLVTYVVNKLKSWEAYLVGGGHMVLGVSWGPGEGAGSHWMAGFRVPGAVLYKKNIFLK